MFLFNRSVEKKANISISDSTILNQMEQELWLTNGHFSFPKWGGQSKNIMCTMNKELLTDVGAIIVISVLTYKTCATGKAEER